MTQRHTGLLAWRKGLSERTALDGLRSFTATICNHGEPAGRSCQHHDHDHSKIVYVFLRNFASSSNLPCPSSCACLRSLRRRWRASGATAGAGLFMACRLCVESQVGGESAFIWSRVNVLVRCGAEVWLLYVPRRGAAALYCSLLLQGRLEARSCETAR